MSSHSGSCGDIFANVGRASWPVMECRLQRSEHRRFQAGPGLRLSVHTWRIAIARHAGKTLQPHEQAKLGEANDGMPSPETRAQTSSGRARRVVIRALLASRCLSFHNLMPRV
jgi:hypothetical protein